ncbi:MAG: FtsX-like permease family protein, partial [Saprospiraceae bacterium]|nr:FtsX-like permease family protein [Saprospiraceae bacterium]
GSRRAKEVGVKKTFGVDRSALIYQYLTESVLMAFISLLLAILFVAISIPKFNLLTDKQLTLSLSPALMSAFFLITLVTGLLAGSYPALYLSSFKPVLVLKGEIKSTWGELWARRGLVIFQFTLSIVLIISVLTVYQQIKFVMNKNLGYDKDQLVHFQIDGKLEDATDAFLTEARRLPGIEDISTIAHDLVGQQNNTSGLNWDGKNPDDRILFENVGVNYELLETIGVELKEGRFFSREFGSDTNKIIFNEAAIKVMGFQDDPIGKVVTLWEEYPLEIIGVVKDFHFESLHDPITPLFFRLNPDNTWVVMARIAGGRQQEAINNLQNLYEKFNPGFPFEYQFVDEDYQRQYAAEQRVSSLSRYFAGLAILISCLGLLGLAAFTGEMRKKEIGVRKVLGASVFNVVLLLTKDFTRLVIVAILIGIPIAYLLVAHWLDRFEFKIGLHWWFFLGAGFLVLLISWFTTGSQALIAARVHPNECLRDE